MVSKEEIFGDDDNKLGSFESAQKIVGFVRDELYQGRGLSDKVQNAIDEVFALDQLFY